MSRYTSPQPAGQPPSLRKIAENHTSPASFPADPPRPPASGKEYKDPAAAALPSPADAVRKRNAADKKPFK
jgi:hypothetical protein